MIIKMTEFKRKSQILFSCACSKQLLLMLECLKFSSLHSPGSSASRATSHCTAKTRTITWPPKQNHFASLYFIQFHLSIFLWINVVTNILLLKYMHCTTMSKTTRQILPNQQQYRPISPPLEILHTLDLGDTNFETKVWLTFM